MYPDKEHSEVTTYFIKEEWLTNELVDELMHFTPTTYKLKGNIDKLTTDYQSWFLCCCTHVFYKGRHFANYRQLGRYAILLMESWKSVKHRDRNSFRYF